MKNMNLKKRLACAALVYFGTCGAAMANANLADEKDCFSCHSIDEKSIGPAYQDVAARYAGQNDAVNYLVNKVMNGSRGDWGRRRMPANDNVNKDEARQLVEWILSLKKSDAPNPPLSNGKEQASIPLYGGK